MPFNKSHCAKGECEKRALQDKIKRLQNERDELYRYVNGLIGLTQLVRGHPFMHDEISSNLKTNHRVVDAAAYLTQIVPPKNK